MATATYTADPKFARARALFPHTQELIYFNSASYGPFCTPVADAVRQNVQLRLDASTDDGHDADVAQSELREIYASFVGAQPHQVGLGLNTSFGLNIAAFGLPLKEGDEVLISDCEFPALAYVWRAAAERRGLKLTFVISRNRCYDIGELEKSITTKTRVIAVSYVQFFNGWKNDLATISQIAKEHHCYFVVDGIQGMGVEPINVVELGIDVFSSGCQKWLLSPQGCGFFYLTDEVRQSLQTPFMSWLGVDWQMTYTDLFHYDKEWFDAARKFELGYYAVLNIFGMRAAAELFVNLGIPSIQRHTHALIDRLAAYINSNSFYRITSSMEEKHRSSIFTFSCENYQALHKVILKERIILVQREGSIRVSCHLFNNEQDIDRLIGILDAFSKHH